MRRIKTTEMKVMRHTAGYDLLDSERIEDILEQVDMDPSVKIKFTHCPLQESCTR
jgi:hypothetical protein